MNAPTPNQTTGSHEFWMPFPATLEWDQRSRVDRAMTWAAMEQVLRGGPGYAIYKQGNRVKVTVPASYAAKVIEAGELDLPMPPAVKT